jgi:signal peptidase II
MSTVKRIALIVAVLIACIVIDQITKSIASSSLVDREMHSYLGDTVRLQLTHNPGAFLSLGASLPEFWRKTLLSAGTSILLLGLLWYVFRRDHTVLPNVAMALIAGGGISNLIDRLLYDGYVVDFLNMGIGSLRTGIFNVADMQIMAGVGILLVTSFGSRTSA